jgi:hypothetical protein
VSFTARHLLNEDIETASFGELESFNVLIALLHLLMI